jgi:hypothetical protein
MRTSAGRAAPRRAAARWLYGGKPTQPRVTPPLFALHTDTHTHTERERPLVTTELPESLLCWPLTLLNLKAVGDRDSIIIIIIIIYSYEKRSHLTVLNR